MERGYRTEYFRLEYDNLEGEIDKDLCLLVREREKELFPVFEEGNFPYVRDNRGDSSSNFYFSPSHHFRKGLINNRVLNKLKEGGNLISFGSGKAHLEELLVRGFNIDKDKILITDKCTVDFPDSLEGKEVDFLEPFPDFKEKFDIVIFPESFVAFIEYKREHIGTDSERIDIIIETMKKCFEILKEDGEIRIDGHVLRNDELLLIKKILKKEGIKMTCNNDLLILEREKDELSKN